MRMEGRDIILLPKPRRERHNRYEVRTRFYQAIVKPLHGGKSAAAGEKQLPDNREPVARSISSRRSVASSKPFSVTLSAFSAHPNQP
jgi:hypothetical protein